MPYSDTPMPAALAAGFPCSRPTSGCQRTAPIASGIRQSDRIWGLLDVETAPSGNLQREGSKFHPPARVDLPALRPSGSSLPRPFAPAVMLAAVLAGGLSLSACSVQRTVSGWFHRGASSEATAGTGQTYYAAAAGLKVYSEPTSSSKVVGKLALHEKVRRYKVERGYAYVKADASGLAGWVNNTMLLWRLPAAKAATPEPSAEAPAAPAGEEPSEAPEIPPPTQSQEPSPAPSEKPAAARPPTRGKTGPSVFDPY
jgi:hypothetical protein